MESGPADLIVHEHADRLGALRRERRGGVQSKIVKAQIQVLRTSSLAEILAVVRLRIVNSDLWFFRFHDRPEFQIPCCNDKQFLDAKSNQPRSDFISLLVGVTIMALEEDCRRDGKR